MRIFVTSIEGDKPRVFINPEIVLTSQEIVVIEEGCLSLPRLYLDVTRPQSVRVQAWNEKGRPFTVETDGLLARVILHEYDHLEGVLFIDRLNPGKRERAISQYRRLTKG
jgi:peptide deformylase